MTIARGKMLKHMAWFLPALLALAWVERQWPMLAIAVLVVLSLSLGFAHGAMDIFLLRDQQGRLPIKDVALYAAAVALLAAALAPFPGIALIVLILLSLWHFGEQAFFEHAKKAEAWLLRIVQGGSSVMLPVLISPHALQPWVQSISAGYATWIWTLWVGMAALWCALLLAAVALTQPWHAGASVTLWWELAALLALYFFLSPVLAFAVFFGVYHSVAHLWRMRQLKLREGKPWQGGLFVGTMLITWLGLLVLFVWMPAQTYTHKDAGFILRWLVVALAAVTLPHLILVARNRHRLFGRL
jgi:beta-carotene 15,15'-dioxygenase